MSEEPKKKIVTEWSFSFDKLGDSLNDMFSSLGAAADAEVKTGSYQEPVAGAESARVTLSPTVGVASVSALVDSDSLIEADVTYVGDIAFDVDEGDAFKEVQLGQRPVSGSEALTSLKDAFGAFAKRKDLRWDIRLTPNIPLELAINSGMTANTFDLSGLQLKGLRFSGGTGKTDITLPTMGTLYRVTLSNGTGEINVEVGAGADIDLNASNGTGKTRIVLHDGAVMSARVSGGVGACEIVLPPGIEVQVRASSGLGKVNVPAHFARMDQNKDFIATSGTWQTAGYAEAERKITIRYDGGLGSLTITQ
jgi:hypothetical protein